MTNSIIFGIHAVTAVIENNPQRIRKIWVLEGRQDTSMQKLLHAAEKKQLRIQKTNRHNLDKISNQAVHQGIIAEVEANPNYSDADLSRMLDELKKPAFLLILDNIQDPHNLGACLRSANAAGVDAVIIPKDKSASLTAVAIKAASGAAETTPLFQVTNLARTLEELKERGIWIYGTSDSAATTLFETDLKGAIAWVLGAEGSGMRRLTRDLCDFLVNIPMAGTVSSLNVSVATGICLFETVRQRDFNP